MTTEAEGNLTYLICLFHLREYQTYNFSLFHIPNNFIN